MRHRTHRYKTGSTPAHRKAIMMNLATSIIRHGKVKTTHAKCKAVRPYVEKLISLARTDTLANRRKVAGKLGNNHQIVKKLFETVAPLYLNRPGGHTRITALPDGRVGDNASMGMISLVEDKVESKNLQKASEES